MKVNSKQRLYVIPSGNGFSCLGFDVADREGRRFAEFAGIQNPFTARPGTRKHYAEYEALLNKAREHSEKTGRRCMPLVAPQLGRTLERLRISGERVQLHYGDPATGHDWCEEHTTIGRIGLSTGWAPCYLLIPSARSTGGGAILTDSIVKISTARGKRTIYCSPIYKTPDLKIIDSDLPKYAAAVTRDGSIVARFRTRLAAERYVARWV